jgi:peptidoglycan/LPS O-acetylase OafA/YrhL
MPPLYPLTGLRGVAAYSVLIAHAIDFARPGQVPFVFGLSYFGMSLFFCLSGFVIHYNYGRSFLENPTGAAARDFLVARFARLYPLYFVGAILSIGYLDHPVILSNPWVALSFVTLTQTWFNVGGAIGDLLSFSWSISTELFFYLLSLLSGSARVIV